MARLVMKLVCRPSPDLTEILNFINASSERIMAAELQGDRRIGELIDDQDRLMALGPDGVFNTVLHGEVLFFEPSDALLAFVAKFRALDHALFGAERERRGWE